jgi:hypothetical protein
MKNSLARRCPESDMKKRIASFLLPVLIIGVFSAFAATIQQPAPKEKDKTVQALMQQPPAKDKAVQPQDQPEKLVAAPRNIKERTAVYVFVAWLWAAIFVLIYILKLEIKEADRLLDLKFYRDEKK